MQGLGVSESPVSKARNDVGRRNPAVTIRTKHRKWKRKYCKNQENFDANKVARNEAVTEIR